jgi:uncharacterized protein (DUF697 family)
MTSEFDSTSPQESASDTFEEISNEESSQEISETPSDVSNIIKNHVIASLTLGLIPIPIFDIAALTASQMSLLRALSEHYDVPFENGNQKALLMSLVGGSLPVLSVLGLSSLTKFIPGIGTLAGSASLAISAGSMTYAVGKVFAMHFEAGGTFEDFEPSTAKEYFKREFESGKAMVKTIQSEMKAEVAGNQEVPEKSDKP